MDNKFDCNKYFIKFYYINIEYILIYVWKLKLIINLLIEYKK